MFVDRRLVESFSRKESAGVAATLPPFRLMTLGLSGFWANTRRSNRFRRWSLSETATVYIVQASRMLKRFLIVVDKETIEVLCLSKRGWMSKEWTDLEPAERSDLLE